MFSKEAANTLTKWNPISNRIITARVHSKHAKTTIVTVYAPTEDTSDEAKDEFYHKCQDVLDETAKSDIVLDHRMASRL